MATDDGSGGRVSRQDGRTRPFRSTAELPDRRWTSDWIRLAVAVVVLAVLIPRHELLPGVGQDAYRYFLGLPGELRPSVLAVFRLGGLWAVGLVVGAALVGRRWRLARDLTLAGVAAWAAARFIGQVTEGGSRTPRALREVVRLGSTTPNFPVVRLAVIVAVVTTASPYLTRPVRRVGIGIVAALSVGALYLGLGGPNAVFAAIVLGWGIAAAIHLTFGSPGGRPTPLQVRTALRELGIDATDVRLTADQPRGATLLGATDASGPLLIRVLGRDERDARVLSRTWQALSYRHAPGRLVRSRFEVVEHLAYMVLRAEHGGVRVPDVVASGSAGPGAVLLVERDVPTVPLESLTEEELTEGFLESAWDQVRRLHDAGVVHLDLSCRTVVRSDDGPMLVGFDHAETVGQSALPGIDVASFLVDTARLVGPDRAVAAAAFGIGRERLAEALPLMQTAALPPGIRPRRRSTTREMSARLSELRAATAHAVGVEQPDLAELRRVTPAQLVLVASTFLAVVALLRQVGDPATVWATVRAGDWRWIAAAVALSFATNVATAVALFGAVPRRLPVGRTIELQVGLTFANLAVPSVGGLAALVRFLQKQGLDLSSAVAAGGVVNGVGDFIGTAAVFLVSIALASAGLEVGGLSQGDLVPIALIGLVVLAAVASVVFGVRRIRRRVLRPMREAWITIGAVLRSPRQVTLLLGGWIVDGLLVGAVLFCCVAAFGVPIDFWTVTAVALGASTLAAVVAVPGGPTAVGSVATAGALVAVGATKAEAVAAALVFQLVATFVIAVPGWFATRDLLRHDYL